MSEKMNVENMAHYAYHDLICGFETNELHSNQFPQVHQFIYTGNVFQSLFFT